MEFVVSGAEMITAHGQGRKQVFGRMCEGEVAVSRIENFCTSHYKTKHAYEIKSAHKLQYRSSDWLEDVIKAAIAEAKLDLANQRVAVVVGTGLREQPSAERWYCNEDDFDARRLHYERAVQEALGQKLPVFTIVNACAASLCSLQIGCDMLELQQFDAVVVAGVDTITESMYGLLDRVTSTPPEELNPFEQTRKGVLMGDGAAAIVVQTVERANKVLAHLRSTEQNCDAFHETAPDKKGITQAIVQAHEAGQITPADIDLIMAHGTGTELNDSTEGAALRDVFKEDASNTFLLGLKSLTGHTAGASGLIGLITAIEIMQQQRIPPTHGLLDPIECVSNFNLVTEYMSCQDIKMAQINAFGFGGINAVVVLEMK